MTRETIPSPDTGTPASLSAFIQCVQDQNPMHQKFLDRALGNLTAKEMQQLETYIHFCEASGRDVPYLAESYLTIVQDTLREQIYFDKNGQYRHNSFADVASDVYFNDEYMAKYMYGLAITSYLWPNHLEIQRFFQRTLPTDQEGTYLEIGPGHGAFIMYALQNGAYDQLQGIDISETSITQTRNILDHFKPDGGSPYTLDLMDFLEADLKPASYQAVVMGEVLEHVEQPDIFLKRIAEIAADDAYIFITTCVNAPAVDHIYLYNTTDEVSDMINACGLRIKQDLLLPYEGKTLEESREEKLPINVAYVLEKP